MSHFLPTRTCSDSSSLTDNDTSVPSRSLLVFARAFSSPLLLPSLVLYTLCPGPSLSASIHVRTIGELLCNGVNEKLAVPTQVTG